MQILDDETQPYEIATPYSANTLFKLRFVQSADVLYLVHGDYPPMKLMRYGHADWKLEELAISGGPFMDENSEETTLQASDLNGEITLTASGDVFESGMEGMIIGVDLPREETSISKSFTSNSTSETIEIKGLWQIDTTGAWVGTLKLERSFNNGDSWQSYRSWTSNKDRNIVDEGEEEEDNVLYRMRMVNYVSGSGQKCKRHVVGAGLLDYGDCANHRRDQPDRRRPPKLLTLSARPKRPPVGLWGSWNDFHGYPERSVFMPTDWCSRNPGSNHKRCGLVRLAIMKILPLARKPMKQ